MPKKYNFLYYSDSDFSEHAAHLTHHANTPNAVANLGYSSLLGCHQNMGIAGLPNLFAPLTAQNPSQEIIDRYNLQDKLKVVNFPIPWPFGKVSNKLTAESTLICKYYLPLFIRRSVEIVHSRNWNFVKASVKNSIPTIYEHHHYVDRKFSPEIVRSPFFKVVVTVSQPVLESLVAEGIPREKIVMLHSGFNQSFLKRSPEDAKSWRHRLLDNPEEQMLVVYAGGLNRFKGVDLLLQAAELLPNIQFAIAGGNDSKIKAYQRIIDKMNLQNVTLLGCLNHCDLPHLFQAADVLAHPHLATQEATFTSPLKFFEYMASGTPIVASKIVTLEEFVQCPAVIGWCAPNEPNEFARCIQETLDKYPRQPEGYLENLQFANQFSWESRMQKVLSYV